MSREVASMLAEKFGLNEETARLLLKNIRSLNRNERKFYFQCIKPRENEFKDYLAVCFSGDDPLLGEKLFSDTVNSMLERRGDPDLADSMFMDVAGRLKVYKSLRERSEKEGVKLSALTNFGGLSMVLFVVVIITAIVLYLQSVLEVQ